MEHQKNKEGKMARSDESDPIGALAERFQELLNAPKELKRPPGTITASEYAEKTNTNQKTVSEYFRKLAKQGKIERIKIGSVCYYSINEDWEEN